MLSSCQIIIIVLAAIFIRSRWLPYSQLPMSTQHISVPPVNHLRPFVIALVLAGALAWWFDFSIWGGVFTFLPLWFVAYIIVNANVHAAEEAVKKADMDRRLGITEKTRREGVTTLQCVYLGGHKGFRSSAQVTVALFGDRLRICNLEGQPIIQFNVGYEDIVNFEVITPDHPYVMNLNVAGVLTNAIAAGEANAKRSAVVEFTDQIGISHSVLLNQFQKSTPEDFVSAVYRKKLQQKVGRSAAPEAAPQLGGYRGGADSGDDEVSSERKRHYVAANTVVRKAPVLIVEQRASEKK